MSFSTFRKTKGYDLLIALPLIGWYILMLFRDAPFFLRQLQNVLNGGGLLQILQFLSTVGSIAFSGLLIVLLLERHAAVGRLPGLMPRLTGFLGTFMVFLVISLASLKPVVLPFWVQAIASTLVVTGFVLMLFVVYRLGQSFSIMPEARALVTNGPYAIVRHPLYMTEEIAVIGMVMQYQQPWALLIGLAHLFIQYRRTVYEEQVLSETFPEYKEYQARTWRFIPGLL